jgi:simple sugar transport system ATP-binding protein
MDSDVTVLEMRSIRKEYYGTPVLKDVDLTLRKGEIHALVGENGAGKSTLMNVLFGMPVIFETGGFEGEIHLRGNPVQIRSPSAAMALGIGMVHQEFMLLPGFSIFENVKLNRERLKSTVLGRILGQRLELLDIPAMRDDTRKALDRIELGVSEEIPVGSLPVGHMQFVEIARELDKEGLHVLVFDEPTAVLAESEAETLLDAMQRLAEEDLAILFITHRLEEVMKVADTVTILRDGERVVSGARSEMTIEEIAEKMVGRVVESIDRTARSQSEVQKPILRLQSLQVTMPGEEVRGVDLEVHAGEILGIGGLAGQGKIGIANGLMGLYPTSGKVLFRDRKLALNDPKGSLAAGIAFVSEDRRGVGLLLDESVEMNIAIPAMEVKQRYLRAPKLGPLAWVDRRAVRRHAKEMIEKLDIRVTGPDQVVGNLSGGNQQKVCLARALGLDPQVLLVSEPTRGIDIGAKQLVLDWLVRLNREQGMTIIMTSSELAELRSVCHRVAIVSEGKVVGILPPDAPDVKFGLLMTGEAA